MAKSSTERSRESRARYGRREYLATYLIGGDVVDLLVDEGFLLMSDSENRALIQEAFACWVGAKAAKHAR